MKLVARTKINEYMVFDWPGYHTYQFYPPMLAWQRHWGKYGLPLTRMYCAYLKGTSSVYVIKKEYEESGRVFFEQTLKSTKVIDDGMDKVEQASRAIFQLGRKWQDNDFRKLSDKALLKSHDELFKWDEQLWQNGQVASLLELHNNYLSEYVKSLVAKNVTASRVNETMRTLTTAKYETITEAQDRDFVKLASNRKLKPGSKSFSNAVRQHWRKYTWMTYGWAGPALTVQYFTDTITQGRRNTKLIKEIASRLHDKKISLAKQQEILKKFTPRERKYIILLRRILDMKAMRVDAHSLTYFIGERLLIELGRRIGLSLNQLRVIPPPEVRKVFRHYDLHQINDEYNLVMYSYERPVLRKLTGAKALAKLKYVKERMPKVKKVKEFRGELAYGGKVRGRVRVILDIKDAHQFRAGEILVSRITDPSYVPLMKKAKAIITDIGGITSHAAIISRELKKVCLVGTDIATKVLKNGDMVEVDATHGIVRKI